MHASSYKEMEEFARKYLEKEKELKILDVGSLDVNGSYRPIFNHPNWTYEGLDLVKGPNVDIVTRDPYRYPVGSGEYDVVISGSALEHVKDTHAFMKELARVVKPGGAMCVIAPWSYPEHRYPEDCWRVMPDGMRFLLEEVAGVNVMKVHKNETDCVGIGGTPQIKMRFGIGALVNDITRLDMCLRQSYLEGDMDIIKKPEYATKALNQLLDIQEKRGCDIAILAHQDMFFRQPWLGRVKAQLVDLPDDWIVAGVIGKDFDGAIKGRFQDMRVPLLFDYEPLPCPAACFDEAVIIIRLNQGFRFDEGLKGFDLYGTLCCLQAEEMGRSAWIIDAFAEHYCMRPFTWYPDEEFERSFMWLHERFPNARKIDSTVLGVPKGVLDKERAEQSA